ncbi:MAG: bifunctional phosphopantothenoylcysteine decarboxylase/phosphopantothenate--cysteine ligase CoaBC [bacterium]|nr:bifunctional phosphopantothenoylcysteine decarboxylase/phosphopantothenate--cysteine ligase CoaBC [bacterium]
MALGVSGGIAAYKACEIVRGLDKAGAGVQVLLTESAEQFVTPLTLQTLSRRKVLQRTFDLDAEKTIQHIELTRQIDALVVAPATANMLAKFARGIADDLLSTFYVSVAAPVVVAPAMNTRMWLHPATQQNLAALQARGVAVVPPEDGWLAEGETGVGRMAEPEVIVEAALRAARRSSELHGRKIVISAGPTREAVDPVRFLSNRSSGKMGFALAAACARRGAQVVLVSGPVGLPTPYGVRRFDVETSREMRERLLAVREGADAVFMAAAVSDYLPRASASKIKRSGGALELALDEGPDILRELGESRCERLLVGFAAETDDLLRNASDKLKRKNLDWIVANDVSRPDVGIEAEDNAVTLLGRNGERIDVPKASKGEIADRILDHVFGAAEVVADV